uniref:Uncharacterized protein n=1 Tax=Catharus ustulatus TaxID=91951 RepID=A0A8C3U9N0_CATUS
MGVLLAECQVPRHYNLLLYCFLLPFINVLKSTRKLKFFFQRRESCRRCCDRTEPRKEQELQPLCCPPPRQSLCQSWCPTLSSPGTPASLPSPQSPLPVCQGNLIPAWGPSPDQERGKQWVL